MYKKLDEKTIEAILESGIDVFVEKGLMGAGMNEIAKRSGVSVGVIYKYFSDKDSFFLHCVNHSLELLDKVLEEAAGGSSDISEYIRKIVYALIRNSKLHANYNAMYHEIMSGGCKKYAEDIVEKIEKRSADIYRNAIKSAQENGVIGNDTDPGILAFFFRQHAHDDAVFIQLRLLQGAHEDILRQLVRGRRRDGGESDQIHRRRVAGTAGIAGTAGTAGRRILQAATITADNCR